MWTLGVDVDLCLWESEPSEEGLEVLNVKAWGVEYLCWELGNKQKESPWLTLRPLEWKVFRLLASLTSWGKPYLHYDLRQKYSFLLSI